MRTPTLALLVAVSSLGIGCVQVTAGKYFSSDEAMGLRKGASPESVLEELGQPVATVSPKPGVELWLYQYTVSARSLLGGELLTRQLTLRFEDGALRAWVLKRYLGTPSHGEILAPDGELAQHPVGTPQDPGLRLVEVEHPQRFQPH